MPKTNLEVNLKSKDENTKYEIIGNLNKEKRIITYFEPTKEKTKVEYFYNENKLLRNNDLLEMTYYFDLKNKTQGIINVKDLNKKVYVEIKTKELIIKDYNVIIKFLVENQEFIYNIGVKEN